MALHSSADLRLLNELLLVISVFDLTFQLVILHLLISVGTKFHHLFLVAILVDFPGDYY